MRHNPLFLRKLLRIHAKDSALTPFSIIDPPRCHEQAALPAACRHDLWIDAMGCHGKVAHTAAAGHVWDMNLHQGCSLVDLMRFRTEFPVIARSRALSRIPSGGVLQRMGLSECDIRAAPSSGNPLSMAEGRQVRQALQETLSQGWTPPQRQEVQGSRLPVHQRALRRSEQGSIS